MKFLFLLTALATVCHALTPILPTTEELAQASTEGLTIRFTLNEQDLARLEKIPKAELDVMLVQEHGTLYLARKRFTFPELLQQAMDYDGDDNSPGLVEFQTGRLPASLGGPVKYAFYLHSNRGVYGENILGTYDMAESRLLAYSDVFELPGSRFTTTRRHVVVGEANERIHLSDAGPRDIVQADQAYRHLPRTEYDVELQSRFEDIGRAPSFTTSKQGWIHELPGLHQLSPAPNQRLATLGTTLKVAWEIPLENFPPNVPNGNWDARILAILHRHQPSGCPAENIVGWSMVSAHARSASISIPSTAQNVGGTFFIEYRYMIPAGPNGYHVIHLKSSAVFEVDGSEICMRNARGEMPPGSTRFGLDHRPDVPSKTLKNFSVMPKPFSSFYGGIEVAVQFKAVTEHTVASHREIKVELLKFNPYTSQWDSVKVEKEKLLKLKRQMKDGPVKFNFGSLQPGVYSYRVSKVDHRLFKQPKEQLLEEVGPVRVLKGTRNI